MKLTVNIRGGIYSLTEDVEFKAKLSTLNRRMEELKQRNHKEIRAVTEVSMPSQPCFNCQSTNHQGENYPISPSVRDLMVENAMLWAKIGHQLMPSMAILIISTGRTTPTCPGSLNLLYMFPQGHISSNSMGPPLCSSSHQPHHLWSKLS